MIKERVYFNLLFKHCEPGKEVMRVKWGRQMKGLLCVGHWGLIMLHLMCEERSRSKCLTSVIIRTNLVGKTERGHCKTNNRRFSPSIFIILLIYFWLCWVSVAT